MENCSAAPEASAFTKPSAAGAVRRAVIDVGTNSVKLLVADVRGATVFPLLERSEQTRLGRGFYETHRLQPDTIQQTARAVAAFAAVAKLLQPVSTRVIATSAAREAVNQNELLAAIRTASSLQAEIISGDTEADWAFRGVTTNLALANVPLLIVDVGGGSTEFILGQGSVRLFSRSFPIGSVRLLERFPVSDPPTESERIHLQVWLEEFLTREVEPELAPRLKKLNTGEIRLIGTGGTSTILARVRTGLNDFDRDRIEDVRLERESVFAETMRFWKLSLVERKKIIGLPPNRADVILAGSAIWLAIMERFNFFKAGVSTRGLRFAALLDTTSVT
ncbi:MAG: Ppx/GppA family phosphatase [Verrucomicrobia bacterium]|nr:Ppx/GppA family phosphatase [Verrucomicrobiota bacterium]